MNTKIVSTPLPSLSSGFRPTVVNNPLPNIIDYFSEHGINGVSATESSIIDDSVDTTSLENHKRLFRFGEWLYFPYEAMQSCIRTYTRDNPSDTEGYRLLGGALPHIKQAFTSLGRADAFIHALRLASTLSELGQKATDILASILTELVLHSPLTPDEAIKLLEKSDHPPDTQEASRIRDLIDHQERFYTTCRLALGEILGAADPGKDLSNENKRDLFRYLTGSARHLSLARDGQDHDDHYEHTATLLLAEGCRYYNDLQRCDFNARGLGDALTRKDSFTRQALEHVWDELFAHAMGLKDFSYRIRQTLFTIDHEPAKIALLHEQVIKRVQSTITETYMRHLVGSAFDSYGFSVAFPADSEKKLRDFLTVFARYLNYVLKSQGLEVEVSFRVKNLFSIVQKIEKLTGQENIMALADNAFSEAIGSSIGTIEDLLALRVVTTSKDNCYAALAILRQAHLVHREKGYSDYYASPKKNGYRSIHAKQHVSVGGKDLAAYEIQIRDKEADIHAKEGRASHYFYKSSGTFLGDLMSQDLPQDLSIRSIFRRFMKLFDPATHDPASAPANEAQTQKKTPADRLSSLSSNR